MNAPAKYAIWITLGLIVEVIAAVLSIAATFTGCRSAPLPDVFSFVFPYGFILAPHGSPEGFVSWLIMITSAVQMPFYGWILAHQWVRHRLLRAMLVLACVHLLAGAIGFEMARTDPNPLIGWRCTGMAFVLGNALTWPEEGLPPQPKAIKDDYQDFVKKLPTRMGHSESYWIDEVCVFEDGTGRHAVDIEIQLDRPWHYALFYDKNNRFFRDFPVFFD
jgi:hypothetical protein